MKPMNAILLSFFFFLMSIAINVALIVNKVDTSGLDNYLAAAMAICFVWFIVNVGFNHSKALKDGRY